MKELFHRIVSELESLGVDHVPYWYGDRRVSHIRIHSGEVIPWEGMPGWFRYDDSGKELAENLLSRFKDDPYFHHFGVYWSGRGGCWTIECVGR